jgi:hypothetical protein
MVAAEKAHGRLEPILGAMEELRPRLSHLATEILPGSEKAIERDLPESEDHPNVLESLELPNQEGPAVVLLFAARLVVGRSAPDDGGDVRVAQLEPVVPGYGSGRARETVSMESLIEPVSAPIPREHAAGSISAVSRGRQSHDHQSSVEIPKAGDRFSPVLLVRETPDLLESDLLPVRDQARTSPAPDDFPP